MRTSIALHLLLLGVLAASCGAPAEKGDDAPAAIVPEGGSPTDAIELQVYDEIGGDFTLTDHRGEPFRLAETHGRIRLLFFGYAMCPDVCPLTMSRVVRIRELLGDDADELLTLFVTVDPERDTPEKLADYLTYFRLGDAVGLTGETREIDAVVDLFRAMYEKQEGWSAAGYLMSHTSYLFLLDGEGVVRALFPQSAGAEQMAATIRQLL